MTKLNRYTYAINEPEAFEELLKFWADQGIHYPVFVEWLEVQQGSAATYWLETELYRASITINRQTAEETFAVLSKHSRDNHEFIECRVGEDAEAFSAHNHPCRSAYDE